MSKKLRRRTPKERLGELKHFERRDWLKLFPRETEIAERLASVQPKIREKMLKNQEAQEIGRLREEKVFDALQNLKKRQEIHDFLPTGKLSLQDLIEGVDFLVSYIEGSSYKILRLSVTGRRWVKKDHKKHPENPVLSVDLKESRESIEYKILTLRNGQNNHYSYQ